MREPTSEGEAEVADVKGESPTRRGEDDRQDTLHLVGIAGSLRQGSFNRLLLRALAEYWPVGVTYGEVEIGGLPPYNDDHNEPNSVPEAVVRFKERLAVADGYVVATPEYNYSIPGVLKNALDWASRPVATSPVRGKAVGIIGASQGTFGTVRAQLHLRQVCVFLDLYPLNRPEILVRDPAAKFDAAGRLVDEPTRELLRQFAANLVAWTKRIRAS
jgi:chromate reductase